MRPLLIVLLIPQLLFADPARRDCYGDPLPEGAIRRLGTGRLKHPSFQRLTVTEDGKSVVTVGYDYCVRVWSAETGKLLRVSYFPTQQLDYDSITVDGSRAATIYGRFLIIWNLTTGERLHRIPIPDELSLATATFHPDGDRLATADERRPSMLRLWNLKTGEHEIVGETHEAPRRLAFVDRKHLIPIHANDAPSAMWDIEKKEKQSLVGTFRGSERERTREAIPLIDFEQNTWQLWDVNERQTRWQKPLKTWPILLSPKNDQYLTMLERRLEVRDTQTDRLLYELAGELPRDVAFSTDGRFLFMLNDTLQKIDLRTGKNLWPVAPKETGESVGGITWLDDSTHLIVRQGEHLPSRFGQAKPTAFHLWNVSDGRSPGTWQDEGFHHPAFRRTANGTEIYTVNPEVQRRRLSETGILSKETVPAIRFDSADARVRSVGVSVDGTRLVQFATRPDEAIFSEVDLKTNRVRTTHRWTTDRMHYLFGADRFSRDASCLCFAGVLFRMPTAEPFPPAEGLYPFSSFSMAITPAADLYADRAFRPLPTVSLPDHEDPYATDLVVWERCTGRVACRIVDTDGYGPAFHPNGRFIALAEKHGIRIWNLETAKPVRFFAIDSTLPGMPLAAHDLEFSPDGTKLASSHFDTSILIWDTSDLPALPRVKLTEAEIEPLWRRLGESDASRANAALWKLAGSPETVLPFLKARLQRIEKMPLREVEPLIARLEGDDFRGRESAFKKLGELGDGFDPHLRDLLKRDLGEDLRKRLQALPETRSWKVPPTGEDLLAMRGVRLLETIGGPDALKQVEKLAEGLATARATQEAIVARERMRHGPSVGARR